MKKLIGILLVLAITLTIPVTSLAAKVDCPTVRVQVDRGGYIQEEKQINSSTIGTSVLNRYIDILCTSGHAWWPYAKHPDTGDIGYIHLECLRITLNQLENGLFGVATLKKGDTGEAVKNLQRCLKYLGKYSGNIDGIFGSGTETAVESFQKVYKGDGLAVDGLVGPSTKYYMLVATGLNQLCEKY